MADTFIILDEVALLFPVFGWQDPYRNTRFYVLDEELNHFDPDPVMTTLSGTVVNNEGTPLSRNLKIFKGVGLSDEVAFITSTASGTFEFTTPGAANDYFTVVVLGEEGEDCPMFTKIKGSSS